MIRPASLIFSLVITLLLGCGDASRQAESPSPAPAPQTTPAETEHEHGEGPHGGVVADWGGGVYHVEFVVDHDAQEATVYILDSDAQQPVAIRAEKMLLSISAPSFQVELKAMPLDTDPEGASTRFSGQHENLGRVQEFAGTISGEVEGTPYAGDFTEEAHEH